MKKAAIIYHKSDFDGIASCAIARKALENRYAITPYPYAYGCKDGAPGMDELKQFDLVVIVDVCLPAETMRQLYALRRMRPEAFDCQWIDHHESSISLSVQEGFSLLHGYRQPEGKGACELVWEYFRGYGSAKTPKAVQYLSAYDVHDKGRFDWKEEVMPFQWGMRERYDLDAAAFVRDYEPLMNDKALFDSVLEDGRRILRYEIGAGSRGVEQNGFEVTIAGGTRGLCCLTSRFGSLAFESRMEREGQEVAVCVNRISADAYRVAMYAPGECGLNLGRYMAENYGGGGHPGAAGGTLTFEQFKTLLVECKI